MADLSPAPFPLGIQTFETIRREKKIYVDKTSFIEQLATSYARVFLSRPRRFGKSLLLSTFDAYFSGKKELFAGLALSEERIQAKYPVITLDLSPSSIEPSLEKSLAARVRDAAAPLGIELQESQPADAFSELIRKASRDKQCVVLIDEYDKPITDSLLLDPDTIGRNISILRTFYSAIKAQDRNIRFCFITGVSRFSKVSVFSGINNLEDLSYFPEYAAACGYTLQEVIDNFSDYLDAFAQKLDCSRSELLDRLTQFYNGYRFTESEEKVFNPVSILRALSRQEFQNFWYETATPTFLIRRVQKERVPPLRLDHLPNVRLGRAPRDPGSVSLTDLLFQTGYLTIKEVEKTDGQTVATLGWPNEEVRRSFYESLLEEYGSNLPIDRQEGLGVEFRDALKEADLDAFFARFNTLLASIPYHLFTDKESYYHSLLHTVLQVCGFVVHSEKAISTGRIDCVCETPEVIWLFECKLDASVTMAYDQILSRHYLAPYRTSSKSIYAVAVSFATPSRSTKEWTAVKVR